MEKRKDSLSEPRGAFQKTQGRHEGRGKLRGGGFVLESRGKAFGPFSGALFTGSGIPVKMKYRRKQSGPYCLEGTNVLELMG